MAYCDYIRCRDCKSKFIYDGDNNIRRSLEFAYGNKNAPNWTVELVCPNCLARLERKPLTESEVNEMYRELFCVPKGKTLTHQNWFQAGVAWAENAHGIGGET
jgi:hypothetical protein